MGEADFYGFILMGTLAAGWFLVSRIHQRWTNSGKEG